MSRRWWTLVAVSLATLMAYLDNNVVNVALPTIQRDLHLSVSGLEWVVSSYLLVFAGLLLAGGRLADHYGRRRVFLAGLSIFTVASLASGLAGNAAVLIASRAVQGLGAALVVPTTLAIIIATFTDARERTTAIGAWTAIGAMALAERERRRPTMHSRSARRSRAWSAGAPPTSRRGPAFPWRSREAAGWFAIRMWACLPRCFRTSC